MNDIEEQLWNYIDGSCSAGEQQAISKLIASDDTYQQKYQELLQLNAEFSTMELDEPSMAFTYNVMEAIRNETALTPLKSAINNRVIWGIGAFFILTITALLVFVFASVNWQSVNHSAIQMPVHFKMPDMHTYLNANVIRGFVFFDIVLGLFVMDTYLRKKLNKQAN